MEFFPNSNIYLFKLIVAKAKCANNKIAPNVTEYKIAKQNGV